MSNRSSDTANARKDLLWGMYSDLRLHARHAETLRSNVVNFMIVGASILIGIVANHANVTRKDLPLCFAIALIGLLGLMFSASYTELYERNHLRAIRLRQTLDEEFLAEGRTTIAAVLDAADETHEAGSLYRWSRRLTGSTRRFRFVLPGLTFVSGVILTVVAL